MKLRKPFCGIAALAMLAAGALSVQAAAETPGVVIERDGVSRVEFAPEWGEPPARDGFDAALLRQARAAQKEEGCAFRREVGSAAEAAELLGVPLLHSELLETYTDSQKRLEVCCKPSLALQNTMLDLQYSEDSRAQVDLNCVMNELGEIIELQGTGEGRAFTAEEQQELVRLCAKGNRELLNIQREILKR